MENQIQTITFNMLPMTIGVLPSSYVDSMSYYETLLWLCNYLENTVIPALNNNGEAVAELQAKYIELHNYVEHYFDNLDVQEEINNKLDEMVASGEFEEIIASYLQTQKIYNTHTEMLADAENMANGLKVQTLGYYAKNDGGGAFYYITNTSSEDKYLEDLGNDLYAELIPSNCSINIKQFGAKCDNTNDDSTAIQTCINSIPKLKGIKTVYFNNESTLLLTKQVKFENLSNIDFIFTGKIHRQSAEDRANCFYLYGCVDCNFIGSYIYSERDQTEEPSAGHTRTSPYGSNIIGYRCYHLTRCNFIKNTFENMSNDYFNQTLSEVPLDDKSSYITIDQWKSSNCSQGMYMHCIENLHITNADVSVANQMGSGDHHVYIGFSSKNVFIENCTFISDGYFGPSINFRESNYDTEETAPRNLYVRNCNVKSTQFISIKSISEAILTDNIFTSVPYYTGTYTNQRVFNVNEKCDVKVDGLVIYNLHGRVSTISTSSATILLLDNIKVYDTNTNDQQMFAFIDATCTKATIKVNNSYFATYNSMLYQSSSAKNTHFVIKNSAVDVLEVDTSNVTYIFNTRDVTDMIIIDNCIFGCLSDYKVGNFIYNTTTDTSIIKLYNTFLTNFTIVAASLKYTPINSYLNETLIPNE